MDQFVDLVLGFIKKYFLSILDHFWRSLRLFRLTVASTATSYVIILYLAKSYTFGSVERHM